MIRVLAIAMLAFAALVLVTRRLPESAFQPTPEESGILDASAFALREGAWEGPRETYRLDGTTVESCRVRQVRSTLSETHERVEITEHHQDGRVVRRSADHLQGGGELQLVERGPDGSVRTLQGQRAHGGILWAWEDPETGQRESILERMVRADGGPLILVSGVKVDGNGALLFEGRYRRAAEKGD